MQYKINLILCHPKPFRPVSFARICKTLKNYVICDNHFLFNIAAYCPEQCVSNNQLAKERIQPVDAKMKITVLCLPGLKQKILSNCNYFVRCGRVI